MPQYTLRLHYHHTVNNRPSGHQNKIACSKVQPLLKMMQNYSNA
jgi:hypothetical protein